MLLPLFLLAVTSVTPARAQSFGTVTHRISYTDIATSEFATGGPSRHCEREDEPEAMDTPNPLISGEGRTVVDVVIGWDGRIYSPFVLETSLRNQDSLMRVLHSWRFRPATCNGTPTSVEARILFVKR
jgi:hypothetical protein